MTGARDNVGTSPLLRRPAGVDDNVSGLARSVTRGLSAHCFRARRAADAGVRGVASEVLPGALVADSAAGVGEDAVVSLASSVPVSVQAATTAARLLFFPRGLLAARLEAGWMTTASPACRGKKTGRTGIKATSVSKNKCTSGGTGGREGEGFVDGASGYTCHLGFDMQSGVCGDHSGAAEPVASRHQDRTK